MIVGIAILILSHFFAIASEKPRIEDYKNFWGINRKTTKDEIRKRFGIPERIHGGDRYFYFNETFSVGFSKSNYVDWIVLDFSWYNKPRVNAIPQEIINKTFVGQHVKNVLKAFGQPNSISSDNYQYKTDDGLYVEFQCYDFNDHVCTQIWIQFL